MSSSADHKQVNTQMNKQQSPATVSEGASTPVFLIPQVLRMQTCLRKDKEKRLTSIKIRNALENKTVFLLLFKNFSQYIGPCI